MNTHEIIERVIEREKGYVDNPLDKGGPTKFGITMATLSKWLDSVVTPSDIKALTPDVAAMIYLNFYVTQPGFENINDENLRGLVVDCGVLHGPGTVTRWLQTILEVPVDGIFGPKTVEAVNSESPHSLYLHLCARRFRFIADIVSHDHSQLEFLRGWTDRAATFVDDAA